MVLAHDINQGKRTQDVRITEDVTFDTMLLALDTLKGLRNSGFYKPSPVQLHGIPLGKCGFDLLLEAKSGTGKTAVFTVIALEKLDFSKGLQTVILAPTREIASQICDVIKQIGSNYKVLNVEVVMGGLPVQEDISKFEKKVHIVVGSPGRLRHLIQDKYIDVSAVRLLILDEADKLMEKSFQTDINYIFSVLPKQKQVIMSSATYPEVSKSFIYKYVQNAQHICPDTNSILLGIEQRVTIVQHNSNIVRQTQHRFEELLKILTQKQFKQCLIFCNYQARVGELHKKLTREKWPVEQLYGQQEQTDRLDALKTLQEYKCRILISTDLAARGIDASNVDLVINFEPPYDWQTYLHRIGRAGRFGAYGIAITILSEGKELNKFKEVLGSINTSFDLRNFWSNDAFNLHSSVDTIDHNGVPKQPSNIEENQIINENYAELWNALTCEFSEKLDSVNEIQSLEKLCESFKKSEESTVESFSDLLDCFQNHDSKNVSSMCEYKQMRVNTLHNSHFNSTQKIKNSTLKTQTAKSLNNVSEINNNGKTDIEKCNTNKETTEEINFNIVNDSNTSFSDLVSKTNIENIDSIEINQNGTFQDLLNAGLPTAFGCSKHKLVKSKSKKYSNKTSGDLDANNRTSHHTYDNENRSDNIEVESTKKMKNKSYKSKMCAKSSRYSLSNLTDTDDKYYDYDSSHNTLPRSNSKKHLQTPYNEYENRIKTDLKRNIGNGYHKKQNSLYSDTHTDSETARRHNNYIIWYNQLKAQMKYIELAVYLDEMSKP